jgi:hypothetical protein
MRKMKLCNRIQTPMDKDFADDLYGDSANLNYLTLIEFEDIVKRKAAFRAINDRSGLVTTVLFVIFICFSSQTVNHHLDSSKSRLLGQY